VEKLPSGFPLFTKEERRQEWAREIFLAGQLARELDWYRAITAYKRARILLPEEYALRRMEVDYGLIQCYYFGQKYPEALLAYEESSLVPPYTFPLLTDLSLILSDAAENSGRGDCMLKWDSLLQTIDPQVASDLSVSRAIRKADWLALAEYAVEREPVASLLTAYEGQKKSVKRAQLLNALLPGAGYLYVGQRNTAFTSFVLNALFIAATYHFFHHSNIAAGLITLSLETGWYFGGINGAGLAAKEYNERLYEGLARETLLDQGLFPVLMLNHAF
jgi:hypothetical protein